MCAKINKLNSKTHRLFVNHAEKQIITHTFLTTNVKMCTLNKSRIVKKYLLKMVRVTRLAKFRKENKLSEVVFPILNIDNMSS